MKFYIFIFNEHISYGEKFVSEADPEIFKRGWCHIVIFDVVNSKITIRQWDGLRPIFVTPYPPPRPTKWETEELR